MIDDAILELTGEIGVVAACKAVGRPRSSHHTRTRPPTYGPPAPPRSRKGQAQPRALSPVERDAVLSVLHSERFVDMVPVAVYATLLDEQPPWYDVSTRGRCSGRWHGRMRIRKLSNSETLR